MDSHTIKFGSKENDQQNKSHTLPLSHGKSPLSVKYFMQLIYHRSRRPQTAK